MTRTMRDGAIILLCALALRGAWLAGHVHQPLGGDEREYHALAQRLVKGQGFVNETGEPTAWRTPGFPATLAAIYAITGENYARARVLIGMMTSVTALLVYGVCLLLFDRRAVALPAGLVWAVLPTGHWLGGILFAESLAAFLLLVGCWLTLYADRRRSSLLAGSAGLLLAYAVLTRIYLLPAVLGPLAWLLHRRSGRLAAALACAGLILLGGWSIRNALRVGTFSLSTQTSSFWLGNNAWARGSWLGEWTTQMGYIRQRHPEFDQLDEVGQSRVFVREAVTEVRSHPGRFLLLLPRKAAIFLSPSSYLGLDWVYAALMPFILLGGWELISHRPHHQALWLLAVPILGVLALSLLNFGDPRFRHPVDPLLVVVAAVGMARLGSALMARVPALRPVEA